MVKPNYRLFLSNGTTFEGDDERGPEDLAAAIFAGEMDELPTGWTWIAGLYVRPQHIIGFEIIPVAP